MQIKNGFNNIQTQAAAARLPDKTPISSVRLIRHGLLKSIFVIFFDMALTSLVLIVVSFFVSIVKI